MSGPLYVPVLPAKPHALAAYQQLDPAVQSAVAPLWNLPPRSGLPPDVLRAETRRDAHAVSRRQRHHPAWLDAPFADAAQLTALAAVLAELGELGPLRPVTGPDRPVSHQSACLVHAQACGNGLGIRVAMPREWDGAAALAVADLLARVDPAVETDLLLDLAAVQADRAEATKEALRALDFLMPLIPWRTAAVLSGAFPQVTAEKLEHGLHAEPRMDWHTWRELSDSGRGYARWLSHGDYGIQSVRALARETSQGGGPPWGTLRYTTEESFVLAKVLARGEDRITVNRAAARQLTELPDFRGAAAGAGESWLRDCAHGRGPSGTGNATVWLRVGNVQHMSYVVRSLRT
ncbi:beta family protein [Streptomyces katrae]|uniref:beta family protein n=1 Tax=Streptomyces katrae TaxID=68223 RepID=UPI0004BFB9E1|nr:beta family protein [Streptomyces katrae]